VKNSRFLPFLRLASVASAVVLIVQGSAQGMAATNEDKEKRLSFTAPSVPWSLTIPARDFVVRQKQFKPDGRSAYFSLTSKEEMLNVSFFIEPADRCQDSKSCRDMVWKMGNPAWENPRNVVLAEIGEVSYFEFLIPSFRGQPVQQQNMYAQFVVDGFWVDFHISKVLYTPDERKLFETLVKAIKFEPKKKKG